MKYALVALGAGIGFGVLLIAWYALFLPRMSSSGAAPLFNGLDNM